MKLSDYGLYEFRGYIYSDNLNVTISVQNNSDELFLLRLEADNKGAGHGTAALNRLKAFGRAVHKDIRLVAVADLGCNQERLERFYSRNGFVCVNRFKDEWIWKCK